MMRELNDSLHVVVEVKQKLRNDRSNIVPILLSPLHWIVYQDVLRLFVVKELDELSLVLPGVLHRLL